MYYEGDFVQGFITAQFPNLKPARTMITSRSRLWAQLPQLLQGPRRQLHLRHLRRNSFSGSVSVRNCFPPGAVTGGADLVCAFKDTPTVRSFINYLATSQAQDIWVKRGGLFPSIHRSALNDYPDPIDQKSAQQLQNASMFRFGAGDSMPSAMQNAWWAGVQQYLQNPSQLDSILTGLENTAMTAYSASPTPCISLTVSISIRITFTFGITDSHRQHH